MILGARFAVASAAAAVLALATGAASTHAATFASAASCDSIASVKLANTTITSASVVEAGMFRGPDGPDGSRDQSAFAKLPPFCRVAATLAPSNDSDIRIEVWLPAAGWNGKFEGVGNGGWSGAIAYTAMAAQLARGYATASTDTGHSGSAADGRFAFGHPEKLIDFAYRAVHEMTLDAKAIVGVYYGTAPRLAYFNGCSSGGKQGLKEAQKFPADYDGIVAGAPANYWTHLMAGSMWIAQASLKDPASLIPASKYGIVHKAVIAACDAADGVKDGVLEDPVACHFDPGTLQCAGEDQPTCLTAAQVETARRIYAPATNPRTHELIFPPLVPGGELGWGGLAGPQPLPIAVDHFKYVVFKNPAWNFKTFDFDKDVARADAIDAGEINAVDPNMDAFFGHGGKILMYHGWSDQLIAPQNSINYYNRVVEARGGQGRTTDDIRLFMVPGMAHCGGGDGPNSFDALDALEQWVEHKKAPTQVIASRTSGGVTVRTRPLCPYPEIAIYNGSGSTDEAANFTCRARKRD
jgi:feruloyl esterase